MTTNNEHSSPVTPAWHPSRWQNSRPQPLSEAYITQEDIIVAKIDALFMKFKKAKDKAAWLEQNSGTLVTLLATALRAASLEESLALAEILFSHSVQSYGDLLKVLSERPSQQLDEE